MKITESKLREMIREVITELTGTATAAGAKKKGYKSADTKTKQADYDRKSSTYDTKAAALTAFGGSKYRRANKGGGYSYSAANRTGFSVNPEWTTKSNNKDTAETARDAAETARDTAREADLQKTIPKQKPPAGMGGARYGKGKTAGKGKGKGKKGKDEK